MVLDGESVIVGYRECFVPNHRNLVRTFFLIMRLRVY